MRKHKKLILLIFAVLAASVASFAALRNQGHNNQRKTRIAVLRRQDQPASTPTAQEVAEANHTPADYAASEPADPQKRAQRRARGKRYDRQAWVKEPSPTTGDAGRYDRWMHRVPSFPVATSDAVVIGEITDAQAYLSTDKTGVYTEFNVRVDEVLKGNNTSSLTLGSPLAAQREGGRVRFPSGRIQRYKPHFQGTPRVGSRYVLFLKRNDDEQSYFIWTGYELRAGRVHPLDGVDLPGGATELPQFAAYKDTDEAAFMSDLRAAITNPSQASRE